MCLCPPRLEAQCPLACRFYLPRRSRIWPFLWLVSWLLLPVSLFHLPRFVQQSFLPDHVFSAYSVLNTEPCNFAVQFAFVFLYHLVLFVLLEGTGTSILQLGKLAQGDEAICPSHTEKRAGICFQFATAYTCAFIQCAMVQSRLYQ